MNHLLCQVRRFCHMNSHDQTVLIQSHQIQSNEWNGIGLKMKEPTNHFRKCNFLNSH